MAKEICFFNKDNALVIKAPRKSPLILRMVVLFFVMVCGIYICSICLKQVHTQTNNNYQNIKMSADHQKQTCSASGIEESELPFIHFPKPVTFQRDECACNPVRYFAILSMQRSGSGWFETLLNSHMNISSNGEIFSVKDRRDNISSIVKTMDKVYNLDWFTSASKNECTAAIGFKWMLNQGLMKHHKEIVDYFNRRGVSAIFLLRRNLLRRMISITANAHDRDAKLLNGTHKSHVHSLVEAQILANYKPKINPTTLATELREANDTAAEAIERFKSTHQIILYYEDIVKNLTKLKDVLKFLRLPYFELKSRQMKIHTAPVQNQVENWDDVEKSLKGTPYESFILADQ